MKKKLKFTIDSPKKEKKPKAVTKKEKQSKAVMKKEKKKSNIGMDRSKGTVQWSLKTRLTFFGDYII